MSFPGTDYTKLAQQTAGPTGEFTQGIDPNWTALATAYGFRPNPYPAIGTEGQDQMRFLAMLKNISDAQLGGPNGPYAKLSPGNPMAAMPFGMNQYMQAMAPLFQSVQGRNLLPLNQATMFAGGYPFGPIDTSGQSGLMAALAASRSNAPVGQNPYVNPGGANQPAANTSPAQSADIGGGNTPAQNPPDQSAASVPPGQTTPIPNVATSSPQQDIIAGLQSQQPSSVNPASAPGLPSGVADRQDRIDRGAGPPPPLVQAWNAYQASRGQAGQQAMSKNLDFWTNPAFQDFANWVKNSLGQR